MSAPVYSPSATPQDFVRYLQARRSTFGEATDATAQSALASNTVAQVVQLAQGGSPASAVPGESYLTPEEQTASPDWRPGFVVDKYMTSERLKARAAYRDAEDWRRYILTQRDPGALEQVYQFGVGLVASIPDPLNFVPVGELLGVGRWAAKAVTRTGRVGRLAAQGAVDAGVGALPAVALQAYNRSNVGIQTSFQDAVYDIALNAAAGGVLGAGFGWWTHRTDGPRLEDLRPLAAEEAAPLLRTADPIEPDTTVTGATAVPETSLAPTPVSARMTPQRELPVARVDDGALPPVEAVQQELINLDRNATAVMLSDDPFTTPELAPGPERTRSATDVEPDPIYARAVELVDAEGRVGTSFLQRKLGLKYEQAKAVVDRMEREGRITAPDTRGRRSVVPPEEHSAPDTPIRPDPVGTVQPLGASFTAAPQVIRATPFDGFEIDPVRLMDEVKDADAQVTQLTRTGEGPDEAEFAALRAQELIRAEDARAVDAATAEVERIDAVANGYQAAISCLVRNTA